MATSASSSPKNTASVLHSWKEIAAYLGRGVRTVQRYERAFHLPVRRLGGKTRGTVVAIPEDLDAWLRVSNFNDGVSESNLWFGDLCKSLRESIQENRELRRENQYLRSANRGAISTLLSTLSALKGEMKAVSRASELSRRLNGGRR